MPKSPTDGIRFTCQPGCTRCCDMEGFVYLTEDDLNKAAAYMNLSPQEFELRYVYRTRHQRRLRKPRGSQCEFLTRLSQLNATFRLFQLVARNNPIRCNK